MAADYKPTALLICAVYAMFVIVAPVLTIICWLVLWVSGCRCCAGRKGRALLTWVHHIYPHVFAWVGLDIVALTAFAASFEMDLAVQFIVEHKFNALCTPLRKAGEPCVAVEGALKDGWAWLLAAVMLFNFVFAVTARHFGMPRVLMTPAGTQKELLGAAGRSLL